MAENPTTKFRYCNHHHKIGKNHKIVDFGDGEFVANNDAIPLLRALNEIGIKTRTHHIVRGKDSFISIVLDDIEIEERTVNEIHADRTKYNGKKELLISFQAAPSPQD